ncbi:MAG: hypothetical protein VYD25_05635 [Pseudomonadota bacterium]|nr:hypothetical protein [Pseudomonadota bacterium]
MNTEQEIEMKNQDKTFFSLKAEQTATNSGGPYYTEWPHAHFTPTNKVETKPRTDFMNPHQIPDHNSAHDSIHC